MNLYKYGKIRQFFVHKLVIENFKKTKTSQQKQVNHLDKNKENNCLINLEIVSPRENVLHSIENKIGDRHPNAKLSEENVLKIREIGSKISITELAKKFNCGISTVFSAIKKQTWKHI